MNEYLAHIVDLYAKISNGYSEHCERRGVKQTLQKEVGIVKGYKPTSIVELGIGNGRFAQAVLKALPQCRYTGVDVSRHMLELAHKVLPTEVDLILLDAESFLEVCVEERARLPFVIAPFTMLAHFPHDAQERLVDLLRTVADVSLLNILTPEAEESFCKNHSTEATFEACGVETTMYRMVDAIRSATVIPVDNLRCYVEVLGSS